MASTRARALARRYAFAATPWYGTNPKQIPGLPEPWSPPPELGLPRRHPHTSEPVNGYVIYEGPSLLTGEPILVVVTGFMRIGENAKTGTRLLQTFIIMRDIHPQEAIEGGRDRAICGLCPHRGKVVGGKVQGRSCYVQVSKSVTGVWKAFHAGRYPNVPAGGPLSAVMRAAGRLGFGLRIGTYGDPAAVPAAVWYEALGLDPAAPTMPTVTKDSLGYYHVQGGNLVGWTGYTHQWKRKLAEPLRPFLMASVDSKKEMEAAHALGWATFRISREDEPRVAGVEIVCPASTEGVAKRKALEAKLGRVLPEIHCDTCYRCMGALRPGQSIVIKPHGFGASFLEKKRPPGVGGNPGDEEYGLRNPQDEARRRLARTTDPTDYVALEREFNAVLRSDPSAAAAVLNKIADAAWLWEQSVPPLVSELDARTMPPAEFEAWREEHDRLRDHAWEMAEEGGRLWTRLADHFNRVVYGRESSFSPDKRMERWKAEGPGFAAIPNPHRHPSLRRPRSRQELEAEFAAQHARAGIPGSFKLTWPEDLTRDHDRNARRYARVWTGGAPVFELADQTRWLPLAHRRGLYAHEIGHVIAPKGNEDDADRAAAEVLGIHISYDHRWPGRGLEVARNPRFWEELPERERVRLKTRVNRQLGRVLRMRFPVKAWWTPDMVPVIVHGPTVWHEPYASHPMRAYGPDEGRWLLCEWADGPHAGEKILASATSLHDRAGRPWVESLPRTKRPPFAEPGEERQRNRGGLDLVLPPLEEQARTVEQLAAAERLADQSLRQAGRMLEAARGLRLATLSRVFGTPRELHARMRNPRRRMGLVLGGLLRIEQRFAPDASFWVQRSGGEHTVGRPFRAEDPTLDPRNHFAVTVLRPAELLPAWLYYVSEYAWRAGLYKPRAHGSLCLQHIRLEDVLDILGAVLAARRR